MPQDEISRETQRRFKRTTNSAFVPPIRPNQIAVKAALAPVTTSMQLKGTKTAKLQQREQRVSD